MAFTEQEIIRQDFVDHTIFELLQELTPTVSELEWNYEAISEIRKVIQSHLVRKMKVCTQQEFYPI